MNVQASPMSNLQLELLKLYGTNIPEKQLLDIRAMLAAYFADLIDRDMSLLWAEQQWDDSTLETWKTERLRRAY